VKRQCFLQFGVTLPCGEHPLQTRVGGVGSLPELERGDFRHAIQQVFQYVGVVHDAGRQIAGQVDASSLGHAGGGHFWCGRGDRCGRGGGTGSQLVQARADSLDLAGIGFRAALVVSQLRAEYVSGREKGIDHVRAHVQFFLAQSVQQRFQHVGHAGHVGEPEGAAAAFDGVRRPEDGVEFFQGGVVHIQVEQQGFHACQVFRRLVEKHLVKLAHVDAHGISLKFRCKWPVASGKGTPLNLVPCALSPSFNRGPS